MTYRSLFTEINFALPPLPGSPLLQITCPMSTTSLCIARQNAAISSSVSAENKKFWRSTIFRNSISA